MTRDENGRFCKAEETKEEAAYGYYSKVLNKPFDSLEELKAEEAKVAKAEEEKKQKALARKEEASKVEEAFKAYNAAKREADKEITDARTAAAKKYSEAKTEYAAAVKSANEKIDAAEKAYNQALQEFNDKHPEGFHMTLRDGDNVTTISRKTAADTITQFDNLFSVLLNNWFKF